MGSFKKKAMRKKIVPIKKERHKLRESVIKDLKNDTRYKQIRFNQQMSFVRIVVAWLLPNDTDREWYKDLPHNSKITAIEMIFNFEKYYFLYSPKTYQDLLDEIPRPLFQDMNQIDALHLQVLEKETPIENFIPQQPESGESTSD